MVRWGVTVAVALTGLTGCKKADSFARVTVDATDPLAAVARLHVKAGISGASSEFDVRGGADAGPTFPIPPARIFGLEIPSSYGGTLTLHVDAFDDGDVLL